MKKVLTVFLAILLISSFAFSFAETWSCPNCGREGNDGNFCPICGGKKPDEKVVCINCGKEYDSSFEYRFCPNCGGSLLYKQKSKETEQNDQAAATWYDPVDVGHTIFFGRYEQDNKFSNGQEPIEWIVLDRRDNKALLLSKYALEYLPYNGNQENVTWEECSLRYWLNNDFIDLAFNQTELAAILLTDVNNGQVEGYPYWDTDGGANTQDRIFLPSYAEMKRYLNLQWDFNDNKDTRVAVTVYAGKTANAFSSNRYRTNDNAPSGKWWLRSPGLKQYSAAVVNNDGSLGYCFADFPQCVRPALWLNLE